MYALMPAAEEGKRELRAQVCAAAMPTPAGPFGMGLGLQVCDPTNSGLSEHRPLGAAGKDERGQRSVEAA